MSTHSVRIPPTIGDRIVPVVMGLVAALLAVLAGVGSNVPRIGLRPYIDVVPPGPFSERASTLFGSGPLVVVAIGLMVMALTAATSALPRRLLGRSVPFVAALFSALFLMSPGWIVSQRHEGGASLLLGACFASVGWCLASGAWIRPLPWVAAIFAGLASASHPLWIGASVLIAWVATASSSSKRPWMAGLAALAAGLLGLLSLRGMVVPTSFESLTPALTDLLCAPIEVFHDAVRFDFPTGFEATARGVTPSLGAGVWTLVIAWSCMVAGIDRGMITVVALLVAAVGASLNPGYVPASPWLAVMYIVIALPVVVLSFTPISGGKFDAIVMGLTLALLCIGGMRADSRRPILESRSVAFRFPRSATDAVEWNREKDSARLVLFLEDLAEKDSYAPVVADAARVLVDGGAPAYRPQVLHELFAKRFRKIPNHVGTPQVVAALDRLVIELNLVENLEKRGVDGAAEALEALGRAVPDAIEISANGASTIRGLQELPRFVRRARFWAELGSRLGMIHESIALREAICVFHPNDAEDRARLGVHRIMVKQDKEAIADLSEALKTLDAKARYAGLARGCLGIGKARLGDLSGAVIELERGWSVVSPGGAANLSLFVLPDSLDYYLIAEIVLTRLELARIARDTAVVTQATKDLELILKNPLDFGVRRLPALAIGGRLAFLKGDRDQALALLREARKLKSGMAAEISDGPNGRILHPRYRRMGLEYLAEALDGVNGAEAEKADVMSEIGPR